MAYATPDQLAAALRIALTPANTPMLQACLDTAASEIDYAVDRDDPIPSGDALAERVNLLRAVEWYKSTDAAFGVIGYEQSGALQAPRNNFDAYTRILLPLWQKLGVA